MGGREGGREGGYKLDELIILVFTTSTGLVTVAATSAAKKLALKTENK